MPAGFAVIADLIRHPRRAAATWIPGRARDDDFPARGLVAVIADLIRNPGRAAALLRWIHAGMTPLGAASIDAGQAVRISARFLVPTVLLFVSIQNLDGYESCSVKPLETTHPFRRTL
jgi:hypothetical protein